MHIAHIINVTEITELSKASYLHIAQPLTMKSMVIAKNNAKSVLDVELLAVKHKDESVTIPAEFKWAPNIEKYAWELIDKLKNTIPHRPLPRLKDILSSAYSSSEADYFIFTNVDIGLSPQFYLEVIKLINDGFDAFCINRRDLPKSYRGVLLDENNTELVFSLEGDSHWGIDCFIFRRDIVPLLNLDNVYIGYPPVGVVLKTQIETHSKNFCWLKDRKLTFHLGSDRAWKRSGDPYRAENMHQATGLYILPKD